MKKIKTEALQKKAFYFGPEGGPVEKPELSSNAVMDAYKRLGHIYNDFMVPMKVHPAYQEDYNAILKFVAQHDREIAEMVAGQR